MPRDHSKDLSLSMPTSKMRDNKWQGWSNKLAQLEEAMLASSRPIRKLLERRSLGHLQKGKTKSKKIEREKKRGKTFWKNLIWVNFGSIFFATFSLKILFPGLCFFLFTVDGKGFCKP